jgi:D-alanyl-D-alanine carboxypeptidase
LGGNGSRVLINHNKLLRLFEGAIGVKTGFTKKSGRCLVSCAERDGVRLICVTLNAPNDWNDHKYLLSSSFDGFERIHLAEADDYTL